MVCAKCGVKIYPTLVIERLSQTLTINRGTGIEVMQWQATTRVRRLPEFDKAIVV